MGLPVASSPCETSLRKKQAGTLRLHLPPRPRTAAPAPHCPPAFGSGFNSSSSCNWFPAARPARGRAERHGSCSPRAGTDVCLGLKAGRRGASGHPAPGRDCGAVPGPHPPWRRDGARSARCHHMQGADGASGANHRTRGCGGSPSSPQGQGSTHHQLAPRQQLLHQHSPPTQRPPSSPPSLLTLASH